MKKKKKKEKICKYKLGITTELVTERIYQGVCNYVGLKKSKSLLHFFKTWHAQNIVVKEYFEILKNSGVITPNTSASFYFKDRLT